MSMLKGSESESSLKGSNAIEAKVFLAVLRLVRRRDEIVTGP